MDPMYPTYTSRPASEEIFGKKFSEKPCGPTFCPAPRECWESIQTYKPAYYEPWKLNACPPVKTTMLDEQSPVPYGWPSNCGEICHKLTNLRMTDAYTRRPEPNVMYCVSKYRRDYCRPLEVHILPHGVRCEGLHVCPEPQAPRDLLKPPVQHRTPLFVWHDGHSALNYAEKPFPPNPAVTMAEYCNQPSDDLWNLPCLRRKRLPLPPIVNTCKPLPGGDCSVLLEHRPFDPCSIFFGGPGDRTKQARRLRREAYGRLVLRQQRQNPFPCGVPSAKKPWRSWSSVGGVYGPSRPAYNPVHDRAGAATGLVLGQLHRKTLDF